MFDHLPTGIRVGCDEVAQVVQGRALSLLERVLCYPTGKRAILAKASLLMFSQANDATTQPALRPVLFKLAHRLISSAQTPSFYSSDRFYVHLTILKELELWDDATALLSSEIGQTICNTNLTIDELRREIWKAKGGVKEEGERAQQRIQEKEYVISIPRFAARSLVYATVIVTG